MIEKILTFFLICGLATPNQFLLASDSSTSKLVQMFVFYRHGYYSPSYFFYEGEYDLYHVTEGNTPTYLGLSQSWSLGKTLATNYPEFFENINFDNQITYVKNSVRSILHAEKIADGIVGKFPEWDSYSIDQVVIDSIKNYGICNGCNKESYVDISLIGQEYEKTTSTISPNLLYTEDEFFDIDEFCPYIWDQMVEFVSHFYDYLQRYSELEIDQQEWENLKSTLYGYESDPLIDIILLFMYDAHVKHGLPELEFESSNIENILKNTLYCNYISELFDVLYKDDKLMATLYSSSTLITMTENLYSYTQSHDSISFLTYMMHDDNLYALMQLLMSDIGEYPYFASNMIINVYEITNSDKSTEIYVNGFYNGIQFSFLNCGYDCPIDQFNEMINNYIIDTNDYCVNAQAKLNKLKH